MLQIDGSSKKSTDRKQEDSWNPTKNEAKQVKSALDTALQGLGIRADMAAKGEEESEPESSDHFHDQDESYDEEESTGRRTPESEDSSDKIPVKQSAPDRQHRTMINQASEEKDLIPEHRIPGILNT